MKVLDIDCTKIGTLLAETVTNDDTDKHATLVNSLLVELHGMSVKCLDNVDDMHDFYHWLDWFHSLIHSFPVMCMGHSDTAVERAMRLTIVMDGITTKSYLDCRIDHCHNGSGEPAYYSFRTRFLNTMLGYIENGAKNLAESKHTGTRH